MNKFKRLVSLATFVAMLAATTTVDAAPNNGYRQGRNSSRLAPALALGTVGVVALIAVLVQHNGSSSHSHN